MFKIASKSQGSGQYARSESVLGSALGENHGLYKLEQWAASLQTGIFEFGPLARLHHDIPDGESGLLNLLKRYDPADRGRVLNLFEQASERPSSFCFSTSIIHSDGSSVPLICIGESFDLADCQRDGIQGIFIFPQIRLKS